MSAVNRLAMGNVFRYLQPACLERCDTAYEILMGDMDTICRLCQHNLSFEESLDLFLHGWL